MATGRTLEESALRRMRIPKRYWAASSENIQYEAARKAVASWSRKIDLVREEGIGIYFYGDHGVGKTAAAAVALMHARKSGIPGLFVSVGDLRDAIWSGEHYSEDLTLYQRAKTVQCLVLDGLDRSDAKAKVLGRKEIMHLLSARSAEKLITIITAKDPPKALDGAFPGFVSVIAESCVVVPIQGKDLRKTRHNYLTGSIKAR